MDSVFVPSGEVSALLSQLSSSRLDLRLFEGLNGDPFGFYRAAMLADSLGLSTHPVVMARIRWIQSRGISEAMACASSLDRIASVDTDAANLRVSRPSKPSDSPWPPSASAERAGTE